MIREDMLEWIHQHVKNVVSIEAAQVWQLSQVFRVRTTSDDRSSSRARTLPIPPMNPG